MVLVLLPFVIVANIAAGVAAVDNDIRDTKRRVAECESLEKFGDRVACRREARGVSVEQDATVSND